jgi:hypothetical protein
MCLRLEHGDVDRAEAVITTRLLFGVGVGRNVAALLLQREPKKKGCTRAVSRGLETDQG